MFILFNTITKHILDTIWKIFCKSDWLSLLTLTIKLIITQFEDFIDPTAIRLIENLAKPS